MSTSSESAASSTITFSQVRMHYAPFGRRALADRNERALAAGHPLWEPKERVQRSLRWGHHGCADVERWLGHPDDRVLLLLAFESSTFLT